jgi:hypothetical protein
LCGYPEEVIFVQQQTCGAILGQSVLAIVLPDVIVMPVGEEEFVPADKLSLCPSNTHSNGAEQEE